MGGGVCGSKDLWMMSMFFTIPFGAGVADWTAGGEEITAGLDEDDDGTVHPQMIAVQTRMISRRTENFRIKDRVGAGVVIPFLSRTGCLPVPGNRSG
jgi:hypothetical protein